MQDTFQAPEDEQGNQQGNQVVAQAGSREGRDVLPTEGHIQQNQQDWQGGVGDAICCFFGDHSASLCSQAAMGERSAKGVASPYF
jgi:hypothetical protein